MAQVAGLPFLHSTVTSADLLHKLALSRNSMLSSHATAYWNVLMAFPLKKSDLCRLIAFCRHS